MIKTGMLLLAGLSRVHPEFFFHVISRVQQLHWELALKAHSAVVEGVNLRQYFLLNLQHRLFSLGNTVV